MRNRALVRAAAIGIVVSIVALLALATLQYSLPARYFAAMGLGREDVPHFRASLSLPQFPILSIPTFLMYFRLLLAAAWFGYAFAVIAALKGGALRAKTILCLALPLGVILAVWWPSSLSGDVYGYVGFARMFVHHGMNPYTHTPDDLRAIGDPSGPFARFRHPSIYGPVWTLLSVIIVWLLKSASLWWQVVAMKLLSAVCLVLTAFVGRQVAEEFSPGTGDVTMLAIALNPLFLVEGPGNGHNDLLMAFLMLSGILYLLRKNHVLGSLMLGASIGIKFVSAVMVPWAIWEFTKGKQTAQRISLAAVSGLLVLLPCLVCYLPFWHGMALFQGASHRWHWGMAWSSAAKETTLTYWLTRGMSEVWMERVAVLLTGPVPVLIVFGALSLWMWKRGTEGSSLVAWIILAGCIAMLTMGVPFPWYLTWAWAVSLVRWNRTHIMLSSAYFVIGFICTMAYTIPR